MTETIATGRNRRSLRNILVSPAGQIRLIFAIPVAVLLTASCFLITLRNTLLVRLGELQTLPNVTGRELGDLADSIGTFYLLGIIFLMFTSFFLAISGLLISHRYYGPLIPLLRCLRAMKAGDYSQEVRLRKGDELRELATAVNELNEHLKARG
ncbi:MAG: HAMP domain-containing protein [Bdellovibrionota bacterium]